MTKQAILTFLQQRQSQRDLQAPAPPDDVLTQAFHAAFRAPDHGYLRPWHYIILAGESREKFGEMLADIKREEGAPENEIRKAQYLLLRAPMVIVAIAHIQPSDKITQADQEYAVAASVILFQLALNAQGFDNVWRTGWLVEHPTVHQILKLKPNEKIIGFIYTGKAEKKPMKVKSIDIKQFIHYWS